MRALAAITVLGLAWPGIAEATRMSLAVGSNIGLEREDALQFAEDDARRIDTIMRDLGDVTARHAALLIRPNVRVVEASLELLKAQVDVDKAAGQSSEIIVYFSGHGSEQALHFDGEILPLERVRKALQRAGATLVVLVIDACRTPTTWKGARAIDAPLPSARASRGFIELRASAEGEAAQESQTLRSAVFSHYFASGLRGAADSDGDGNVTLGEAYAHAFSGTLAKTAAASQVQRPTAQQDLLQEGPIILTRTRSDRATLIAPRLPGSFLVFATPGRTVVGELGAQERLAVAPGNYFIVYRDNKKAVGGLISLGESSTLVLDPATLAPLDEEQLASRGPPPDWRRWRLGLYGNAIAAPGGEDPLGGGGGAEVAFRRESWRVGLQADYIYAPLQARDASGPTHRMGGAGFLEFVLYERVLDVSLRFNAGGAYVLESLTFFGPSTLSKQQYGVFFSSLGPSVSAPLGDHWYFSSFLRAGVLVRPETQGALEHVRARPIVSIGISVFTEL